MKKVSIVPLEVIVRNISAGSFAKRYGVEEGIVFDPPTIEFSYKNDDLHRPLLNAYHAIALKLATREEIETIKTMASRVNEVLTEYFRTSACVWSTSARVRPSGRRHARPRRRDLPDTCRFWDLKTNEVDNTASAATWAVWRMPAR